MRIEIFIFLSQNKVDIPYFYVQKTVCKYLQWFWKYKPISEKVPFFGKVDVEKSPVFIYQNVIKTAHLIIQLLELIQKNSFMT